ncbi:major facilitator superfamily protein [Actinidia rufa]|uniref:Major facilitator superfamily protein n=1 Tax=Actinidia rufa TaxID=165716 RepID=A0A7J0F3D5_9ERIC|nr:major facilitator superfamily protein [Actinidia rufa]
MDEERERGKSVGVDEKKWVYDSSVDHNGKIPFRASTGVWKVSLFIIVIEFSERMCYFRIATSLIIYLTSVIHQDLKTAAKNSNYWTGVATVMPQLGGFLADAYLGRFFTLLASSIVYLLNLVTTSRDIARSHKYVDGTHLLSIGQSWQVDGFDSLDNVKTSPKLKALIKKMSFFNWWNFGVAFGILLGLTVIVYVQDHVSWAVADIVLTAVMAGSAVVFCAGRPFYLYRKPMGSPLTPMLHVLVAAIRKRHLAYPSNPAELYEVPKSKNNGRLLCHTHKLKFLDKAAILEDKQSSSNEKQQSPWRPATVTKVEEMKLIVNMIPIWLATLPFGICVGQASTFFIKQGTTPGGEKKAKPCGKKSTPGFNHNECVLCAWSRTFIRSLLITIVDRVTNKMGKSWFGKDLNSSRLDNFYWVLAIISALNLGGYVVLAWRYSYKNVRESGDGSETMA